MITGQNLFLYDHRFGTGPGTARLYKQHTARMVGGFRSESLLERLNDKELLRTLEVCVSESAWTFEGDSVIDYCLRRAGLMVFTLLRSLPAAE